MSMKTSGVFYPFPHLETKRLRLRRLQQEDLYAVFDYASKPEVSEHVLWDTHRSTEDTQQFLDIAFEKYKQGHLAPFGIERKESAELIGTIDYVWWEQGHAAAEIGYVLSPNYWGQGIIPEAASKLVSFGFEQMGLVRIEARCYAENKNSMRVMEKLGMTYEGTIRQRLLVKGVRRDINIYGLLKHEW
ncbi:GNAT family N-acetyltransferase [Alteribacillus sp. YIM 98480]|uniref:GNAT family N-acetyltransferase n=1 Tax=Alteribacillus sp. YIM 98480 TaxID=2606599 RepID=UPI001E39B463|nr:GNAT family protein [Alteribacillus sp. YIM 98480]